MDPTRITPIILAAALALPCPLSASGGWYDVEPPHSLAGDLDRLPAKSLGAIILELRAESTPAADAEKNTRLPEGFLDRIGKDKPETLAAEIDKLVLLSRHDYQANKEWLPVLYDIRDAIMSKGAKTESRKAYCADRIAGNVKFEDGVNSAPYLEDEAMVPHLLYLQGAVGFTAGDRVDCLGFFQEIARGHPDHPRAEGAVFLIARCALSASRADDLDEDGRAKAKAAAVAAFEEYLKRYPNGRYVSDAHGWLGALRWDDQPAKALDHYLRQIEDQSHPECMESAAHMIERALARVVAKPEEADPSVFQLLARHPQVAQAAVYYVLNAPEIDPYDGKFDEPAAIRQWRLQVLPRLAVAVAAEKARYTRAWSLRVRAMLAQAASAEGKQEDALALTGASEEEWKANDDLLFARLVALQRARRSTEAVAAARLFLEAFPQSLLREGVRVRLAQSLVDSHQAGHALLALGQIEEPFVDRWHGTGDSIYPPAEDDLAMSDSAVYPDLQGHDAFESLKQTIVQFAPLPELEAVLADSLWEKDPQTLAGLKVSLVQRKAAREDFAGAAALLKGTEEDPWATATLKTLGHLDKLAAAISQAANPEAKAMAMMALGDALAAWAQEKHFSPLNGLVHTDGLSLRENARALGYKNPDQELEGMHPMRHATKWWLAGARDVPGTPLSAKARLKVLEGIESLALSDDYEFTRARENKMDEASRQIRAVLLKENPGSPEAGASFWLDFPPCPVEPVEGDWLVAPVSPRGEDDYYREVEMVRLLGGYRALPYHAFGEFPPCHYRDEETNQILEPIRQSLQETAANLATWEKTVTAERIDGWLKIARPAAENAQQVKLVNLLEDLRLFLKVPGLPPAAQTDYIQLRLRVEGFPEWRSWASDSKEDPRPSIQALLEKARATPSLKAVEDFLDYVELYANEADRGPNGDFAPVYPTYSSVEKGCRAFLEKYPKSVRREACHVLLMRAIFRQMPERWVHAPLPPGAEEWESGPLVESDEPFRPTKLLKAIDAYEKESPQPRYAAEVRNFRGLIAWRTGDFGTALDLTMAQLDDMENLDLRREAAIRLANIFADLRDPRYHRAVLEAIKARPKAIERLQAYMDIAPKFADHPLRCRSAFIREALAE